MTRTDRSIDETVNDLIEQLTPENHTSHGREVDYQIKLYLSQEVINRPHYNMLHIAFQHRLKEVREIAARKISSEPRTYAPPHHHHEVPVEATPSYDPHEDRRRIRILAAEIERNRMLFGN